jgi:hypothetical protein
LLCWAVKLLLQQFLLNTWLSPGAVAAVVALPEVVEQEVLSLQHLVPILVQPTT